jgi:hypothetical protein
MHASNAVLLCVCTGHFLYKVGSAIRIFKRRLWAQQGVEASHLEFLIPGLNIAVLLTAWLSAFLSEKNFSTFFSLSGKVLSFPQGIEQ